MGEIVLQFAFICNVIYKYNTPTRKCITITCHMYNKTPKQMHFVLDHILLQLQDDIYNMNSINYVI